MKNQQPDLMNLQKKITHIYDRFKPAPDDEDTTSPWFSLIRTALERTEHRLSKLEVLGRFNPYIWELIGDRLRRFSSNADSRYLNPQPIPPRWLFASELASVIVERAQLISDISEGIQKGSAVKAAGNFIMQFADGICPDPPKIKIPKGWPWPQPDPDPRWNAPELAAVAEIFIKVSAQSTLKNVYQTASEKIIETASNRIQ
ncbi:hypothetical protein U0035_10960 [Niabella yanshanensis]|uniref:Uncharacterized protein n=1 Tax=Niabella yanshanensis TaxID=577386 RepID=A0ABZ0WD95_9BACT|nr:hypothetical protein [Niabella yanshanensis]WQD40667.1 hypothetical protein U0035_10960 [Niabella yanshanensis]